MASARPQTNLSQNECSELGIKDDACEVDRALSGSLESVVREFGCEELPFRKRKEEILPLLMLPESATVVQLPLLLCPALGTATK